MTTELVKAENRIGDILKRCLVSRIRINPLIKRNHPLSCAELRQLRVVKLDHVPLRRAGSHRRSHLRAEIGNRGRADLYSNVGVGLLEERGNAAVRKLPALARGSPKLQG